MKVSAIHNNYNFQNSKSLNFNGLWGNTKRLIDRDPVMGVKTDYQTYFYYPYMDETQEDINKVVSDNTAAYIDDSTNVSTYVVKECKVCTTLPFKKVHFDNYQAANSATRMTPNLKRVHFSVQDKYINNIDEQKSAVNEEMTSRLNTRV